MTIPHWLPSIIAALTLLGASWVLMSLAWRDLVSRRLPNKWIASYAVLFFLYALASGMAWSQLGSHVALALGVAVVTAVLFAFKIMGGGDVKLWGALMLWAGPQGALVALVIATLCGGVLGILGWVAQHVLKRSRKPVAAPLFRMLSATRGVPYGVGLALAGLQNVWVALL
ncbi:MAG: prepilin peptidase [Burkholderiaceae bacterium]|nr:prepilin peptidase [Burkholderiaceae bacterium]